MSQNISPELLRTIAQIAEMGKLAELTNGTQALVENKPFGESSRDNKLFEVMHGIKFPEHDFTFCCMFNGQAMKRHPTGGGLVPVDQDVHDTTKPFVAGSVPVSWLSVVSGTSRIVGRSAIFDSCVNDSQVSNSAIFGSHVNDSQVSDSAITDSRVNDSQVSNSWVTSNSWVGNSRIIHDSLTNRIVRDQR